jgi:hypothetical protein
MATKRKELADEFAFKEEPDNKKKYKPATELKLINKILQNKNVMLTVGQFMGHQERVWFPRLFCNLDIFRALTSDEVSKPYWDKILERIFTFFHWTIDDFAQWTDAGIVGEKFKTFHAPVKGAEFSMDDTCALRQRLVHLQCGVMKMGTPFTNCERFFKKDRTLLEQFKDVVPQPRGSKGFFLEAVIYNPACLVSSLAYSETYVDIGHIANVVWPKSSGKCYACRHTTTLFPSYWSSDNRLICSNCCDRF